MQNESLKDSDSYAEFLAGLDHDSYALHLSPKDIHRESKRDSSAGTTPSPKQPLKDAAAYADFLRSLDKSPVLISTSASKQAEPDEGALPDMRVVAKAEHGGSLSASPDTYSSDSSGGAGRNAYRSVSDSSLQVSSSPPPVPPRRPILTQYPFPSIETDSPEAFIPRPLSRPPSSFLSWFRNGSNSGGSKSKRTSEETSPSGLASHNTSPTNSFYARRPPPPTKVPSSAHSPSLGNGRMQKVTSEPVSSNYTPPSLVRHHSFRPAASPTPSISKTSSSVPSSPKRSLKQPDSPSPSPLIDLDVVGSSPSGMDPAFSKPPRPRTPLTDGDLRLPPQSRCVSPSLGVDPIARLKARTPSPSDGGSSDGGTPPPPGSGGGIIGTLRRSSPSRRWHHMGPDDGPLRKEWGVEKLRKILASLTVEERMDEALQCFVHLQIEVRLAVLRKTAASADEIKMLQSRLRTVKEVTAWMIPPLRPVSTIRGMADDLAARGLPDEQVKGFYGEFAEKFAAAAASSEPDVPEAARLHSEAIKCYRALLLVPPLEQELIMNNWRQSLQCCLLEIQEADRFVSKVMAAPRTVDEIGMYPPTLIYCRGVMEVYRVANRLIASSKTYGSCWWRCYQHATATHTLSMLSELARETQQTWDLFRSKVAHLGHRFFVMPDDVGGHIDSALEAPPPLSSPPTPITVDPSRCTLCLLPIRHPFHHPFPHPSHTNHPDLELHSHEAGAGACELIWRDKRFHASCANFWVNRVTINPPFR